MKFLFYLKQQLFGLTMLFYSLLLILFKFTAPYYLSPAEYNQLINPFTRFLKYIVSASFGVLSPLLILMILGFINSAQWLDNLERKLQNTITGKYINRSFKYASWALPIFAYAIITLAIFSSINAGIVPMYIFFLSTTTYNWIKERKEKKHSSYGNV